MEAKSHAGNTEDITQAESCTPFAPCQLDGRESKGNFHFPNQAVRLGHRPLASGWKSLPWPNPLYLQRRIQIPGGVVSLQIYAKL